MISKRAKGFDSKEVRNIFAKAAEIKNSINLSLGEPDFDIPNQIKEEAITHIKSGFNKYTHASGVKDFRLELAKKIRAKNKIRVSPESIGVTPGVSGALLVTALILFESGDEVLLLDPYFPTFPELVKLSEATPVFISTYPDFSLPLDKIKRSISKRTKAVIINSPNNPTGAVYSEKDLRVLAEIAKDKGLIIISDEIYEDYIYVGKHFSIGSVYENTVSLWGFSKTYAMTGWRLGYLTGPEIFMDRVHELLQYLYFSPPSIPQIAAIKALRLGPPKEEISKFKEKRAYILENLSDKFRIQSADGAFYIFIKPPRGAVDKFLGDAIKKKLFMLPGKVFSRTNTHVRISYSVDLDTVKKAVKILNELIS